LTYARRYWVSANATCPTRNSPTSFRPAKPSA
jgi:hypothetical protein